MSMKKMLAVVAAASLVAVAAPAFANPFSDVPEGHWAYDAVEELSAKGIIDGYPDGTFKGTKAMTRYEIATVVAKAIANAGDEDIEQLKALVVEFGPELEALGVKVDGFDARLAKLEKGLSGWKLSGDFRLDYNAQDYDDAHDGDNEGNLRSGFSTARARIYLHRDMANGISFDTRLHGGMIDEYWLTATDLFGVAGLSTKLGVFWVDWDSEDGMYTGGSSGGDATFLDLSLRGAELRYSTGAFEITGFAASCWESTNQSNGVYAANESGDYYGIRAKVNFGEKAWLSANAMFISSDGESDGDSNYDTYWVSAGVKIANGLNIKASYFMQDIDTVDGADIADWGVDDDPSSYKIILEASQDLLKFTSLWIEYNHFDQGFTGITPRYYFDWKKWDNCSRLPVLNGDGGNWDHNIIATDVEYFYVFLKQQWTNKWSTYIELEYADADDYGTYGDDMTRWAIGVGYQYTPALYFELAYSMQDGDCKKDSDYENNILRFRTQFFF